MDALTHSRKGWRAQRPDCLSYAGRRESYWKDEKGSIGQSYKGVWPVRAHTRTHTLGDYSS